MILGSEDLLTLESNTWSRNDFHANICPPSDWLSPYGHYPFRASLNFIVSGTPCYSEQATIMDISMHQVLKWLFQGILNRISSFLFYMALCIHTPLWQLTSYVHQNHLCFQRSSLFIWFANFWLLYFIFLRKFILFPIKLFHYNSTFFITDFVFYTIWYRIMAYRSSKISIGPSDRYGIVIIIIWWSSFIKTQFSFHTYHKILFIIHTIWRTCAISPLTNSLNFSFFICINISSNTMSFYY